MTKFKLCPICDLPCGGTCAAAIDHAVERIKTKRRRGILHSHDPDKPGSDPVLVDGIESFDDDPADWDELIAAAKWLLKNPAFQRCDDLPSHVVMNRLRKALEPKQ